MVLHSIKFVLISFCSLFIFLSCAKGVSIYNHPFMQDKYPHTKLIEATKDSDPETRKIATFALRDKAQRARFRNNKEMMGIIVKDSCNPLKSLLNDEDWQVRRQALRALSEINCGELTNSIISKLTNDKTEVQSAAAYALRMYPSKETIVSLRNVYKNSSAFFPSTEELRNNAEDSLRYIINNDDYMNKIQLTEFIEVPTIPDNFALIYIRCDSESAKFVVDQTKIGKLGKYDYTCFLVKKGKHRFYAKEGGLFGTLWHERNISLEGGKIYNFHFTGSRSEDRSPAVKRKYGSNAVKITRRINFSCQGSEKENIIYNFRPPLVTKIEF